MRFSIVCSCLRIFLGLTLAGQLPQALAAAEVGRSTMLVSMTVLSSCEVRSNAGALSRVAGQWPADAVTVNCPGAFPFRASLAYGASTGVVGDGGGLVFTSEGRVDLSRLATAADRGVSDRVAMVTISY